MRNAQMPRPVLSRHLLVRDVQIGRSKRQHRGKKILTGLGWRDLASVQAAFERDAVGNIAFHPAKGALAVGEEIPLQHLIADPALAVRSVMNQRGNKRVYK